MDRLILLLSKLAQRAEFSICFSSRHYTTIVCDSSLEVIVENHNHDDILNYAQNATSKRFMDKETVVETVARRANGVFLWASLVLNLVNTDINNDEPTGIVLENLNSLPQDIEGIYSRILQGITERDRVTAISIISWVLLAAEPLTLLDLQYALAFTDFYPVDHKNMLEFVGRHCPSSLEEWKKSVVRYPFLSATIEVAPYRPMYSLNCFKLMKFR